MALLNHKHQSPPDDFCFTEPTTGGKWTGETLAHITEIVCEHRKWKGLFPQDTESVSLEIQRQICSGLPPGFCHAESGEDYVPFVDQARTFTIDNVMHASQAAIDFVASGGEMVPQAESARRANICRGCRFNRPSPSCVCTPLYKMLDKLVPKERKEAGLHVCGICSCSNSVKILLPVKPDNFRYPPHCWINSQ